MNPLQAFFATVRRRPLNVFYHEAFRLPLVGGGSGDSRRADDALHYLLRRHAISAGQIVRPAPASYEDLARVHSPQYLESLHEPNELARIFSIDPSDVHVDELLRSVRLAVGATVEAARRALAGQPRALTLFGGFHHAAPGRGAGFCALNDVAVAVAAVRSSGFDGRIAVLDFDFHPPDGIAECLGSDPSIWLGSVSGESWGPLEGVDETLLPAGAGDGQYSEAVEGLLSRLPQMELAFVLAGADVLTGDRLGHFNLSLRGTRRRELLVARRLGRVPQVWLPAGGYSSHAWKVLAGVGLALALDTEEPVPTDYDPLAERMKGIWSTLRLEPPESQLRLTEADFFGTLGVQRREPHRLLDYYTLEAIEYALERYGLLPQLRRLGFQNLRVVFDRMSAFERVRLLGVDSRSGEEHVLVELEVERRKLGQSVFLFVNWLSLRNPRAKFSALRPRLPGQELPGLGLAREMSELLTLMAKRLSLDGVAFRPSWFHMAWSARHDARFVDAERQGRFEALVRDLSGVPLLEATRALADGKVKLNGQPYTWEADEMVRWLDPKNLPQDGARVAQERERCHFSLEPAPS